MASKKNKAKKSSKKVTIGRWQWHDLPQEIIQLMKIYYRVRRKGTPLHYASTIASTKQWMPPPSCRCCRNVKLRWPQLCRLDAPVHCEYLRGNCPYTNHQKVAIVGRQIMKLKSDYTIEFTRPKYECLVVDPFDDKKRYMEIISVVDFEGKLYAMSLQGCVAVIENVDSRPMITAVSSSRAVPSVSSRFFKEYLVELNGEIHIVFFIHTKSLEIIDQVEVFRLCFVKLEWIKVERLQGKALFLDQYWYTWVNSAEIGCRGDCVYFTRGSDNSWWLYDMETCCISPV